MRQCLSGGGSELGRANEEGVDKVFGEWGDVSPVFFFELVLSCDDVLEQGLLVYFGRRNKR